MGKSYSSIQVTDEQRRWIVNALRSEAHSKSVIADDLVCPMPGVSACPNTAQHMKQESVAMHDLADAIEAGS